jgi:hypothetical protein
MKDPLYIPRHELIDMNAEINAVRAQVKEHLMSFPGVLAVGVGLKKVKGSYKRQLCFKITVAEKLDKKQLAKTDVIPPTYFGFETDITAILPPGSGMLFDNTKYRPLIGGCKVEASFAPKIPTMSVPGIFSTTGTLGCFAKVTSGPHIGKIVALTSWHVAVKGTAATDGERLGQPTHNGCCTCCACNEIGKVIGGQLDDTTDAAIILLAGQDSDTTPDTRYLNEVLDIGLLAGSAVHVSGETVFKRGASGILTKGQITDDTYMSPAITFNPGQSDEQIWTFVEQLEITPSSAGTKFAQPGDSGSVIVNEHNQVVGLLFGGNYDSGTGWANQITGVVSQLNIEIKDDTFKPDAESIHFGVPLSTASLTVGAAEAMSAPFEAMEKELMRYKKGAHLMQMFATHQHEILDLVNNNREVMAAWNRYQGPAFLAQIIRSFHRNKPIDEVIKGVRLQNLLLKMTTVLQRNGSSALVQAVNENYVSVMQVLTAGRMPEQWKERLAKMENSNAS